MISLSSQVRERVAAFVSARLEHPLFLADISGAFSPEIGAAWVAEQLGDLRGGYRIIDAHLDDSLGALVVPAHPPWPEGAWGEALGNFADTSLYRKAMQYHNHGALLFEQDGQ